MAKKKKAFKPTLQTLKGFSIGDFVTTTETSYGFNRNSIYEIYDLFQKEDSHHSWHGKSEDKPDYRDRARVRLVWSFLNEEMTKNRYLSTDPSRTMIDLQTCYKVDFLSLLKTFGSLESLVKRMMARESVQVTNDEDVGTDDATDDSD